MKTIGGVMSGKRSTRSWLYENRPRTQSAAITIVAKTGLAIETRVNHMGDPSLRGRELSTAARPAALGARYRRRGSRRRRRGPGRRRRRSGSRVGDAALGDDLGRRALLEVV